MKYLHPYWTKFEHEFSLVEVVEVFSNSISNAMPEPNLCTLSFVVLSIRKESICLEGLFPTSKYFS